MPEVYIPQIGEKNYHDYLYSCVGKERYMAILPATKAAYVLSQFRRKDFEPYVCRYCTYYHIGRVNNKKRPPGKS